MKNFFYFRILFSFIAISFFVSNFWINERWISSLVLLSIVFSYIFWVAELKYENKNLIKEKKQLMEELEKVKNRN